MKKEISISQSVGLDRYVVPTDLFRTPILRGDPIRAPLYRIFRIFHIFRSEEEEYFCEELRFGAVRDN